MFQNDNFAKLVALVIVGGVAKALFAPPEVVHNFNQVVKDAASTAADHVES